MNYARMRGRVKCRAYLVTLLVILIWGITFANTRALLEDFSALEIQIVRFAVAWSALWIVDLAKFLCPKNRDERSDHPSLAEAQFNLGVGYSNGIGIKQDKAEAVKWFRKAALQGDADSQYNLGLCYEKGAGVAKDLTQAFQWYQEAALRGHSQALTSLGVCYFKGAGVEVNRVEAAELFRRAAIQGNPDAQYFLGLCYRDGVGVTKNPAEAEKWLRRAAKKGSAEAKQALSWLAQ